MANLNKSWLITNLESVQDFSILNNGISMIEIQINDVFIADAFDSDISKEIDSTLNITNWKDQNRQLLSGLQGQDISSLVIQIFVLEAIALGISRILAISVVQRSRQIGILKTMGLKDASASLIFLFQGLILGIFGAIFGILFGLGLSYSFTKICCQSRRYAGSRSFNKHALYCYFGYYCCPSATVATVSPARKSSKLSPVEVIRNV